MIPFNHPKATGRELDYVRSAIANAKLAGDGALTAACHKILADTLPPAQALLTHSCTAALEMACILADIGAGDEVIMPSYTFVSTANAVVLRGGVPVFVDIDRDTLNIDEKLVEQAITPRTKAIMVVHYAGVICEMDAINAIAGRHGLLVIEDAAQAYLSTYRGRPACTLGDMGCLSFHETKNIISGEGGAFATRDEALLRRAEIVREKGTNRRQFLRGAVDKYTWVDIGSSYLPSELIAAFLLAQLEDAGAITAKRLAVWEEYHRALAGLEAAELIRRPKVPAHCQHNGHMYYVLLDGRLSRDRVLAGLKEKGVSAAFHYVPLHSSEAGLRFGRTGSSMENTDSVYERLIRLPVHLELDGKAGQVIAALTDVIRDAAG